MNEQKESVIRTLQQGLRYDGRKEDGFREIEIKMGSVRNAEGSATVRIGETEVIAGVKMDVETPYPDTPDEGMLMVGEEFLPMANPNFELGPPRIDAIEIARVVDRGIRESKTIDVKGLCITPKEKVWSVMIDICTINDEGNLMDASALAAMAALMNTEMPSYDGEVVDYSKKSGKKLKLREVPITVTVHNIGNNFIVDPTIEEEKSSEARLTVVTLEDGRICALQKGGEKGLSIEEIMKMVDIAGEHSKKIRELLLKNAKK